LPLSFYLKEFLPFYCNVHASGHNTTYIHPIMKRGLFMAVPFSKLNIQPEFVQALKKSGIVTATPVQEQSIPVIMSGKDTMAQAQTGTGKTLAFILPILQKVKIESQITQALIITPTRELAIQITQELNKLAPLVGAKVLAAYGGQDVEGQIRKLKVAPHIVVATPGRLLDHLRRGTMSIAHINFMVLDEADQMLEMGFFTEVDAIMEQTPYNKQTLLFSATISDSVRKLAKQVLKNPEDIQIKAKQTTVEGTKQIAVETTDRTKQLTLIKMLEQFRPFLAVVFCRTKLRAQKLTEALQEHGMNADELHGDLSQSKREQVMKRFRDANLQILVATDIAARGLDVEGITHVFNYDFPPDKESYIHRIGRTGRAGQTGVAISLVTPRDHQTLLNIERGIKMNLSRKRKEEFIGDQGDSDLSPKELVEKYNKPGSAAKQGGGERKPRGPRGRPSRGAGDQEGQGQARQQGRGQGTKQGQGNKQTGPRTGQQSSSRGGKQSSSRGGQQSRGRTSASRRGR
jgi:ATP-dependent RNA helicase DeaD